MMPEHAPHPGSKDDDRTLVRTAANMADALTFLIQIAMQAGMQSVAFKLSGIRNDLRLISAPTDGTGAKKTSPSGAPSRRPH